MSSTHRGRSSIITRWELTTFVSVALIAVYVLPRHLKVILAIILLIDTLLLPTPFLHLLWISIIQPATSLLWRALQTIVGLLFIHTTNITGWLTRITQPSNVAASKVADATSHKSPQLSNFIVRNPCWTRIIFQRSQTLLGWAIAVYSLYIVFACGFTKLGFLFGVIILAFAISGYSIVFTFLSSFTPLYYGLKTTYRGYLKRLSDWKESKPYPDRATTVQKPNKSFWGRIFDSKTPKMSKVPGHVVEHDPKGYSRVIEPPSRPSLIDVFLPLNPFAAASVSDRPYSELTDREKVDAIMTRWRSAKHTLVYTMLHPNEELAKKTESVSTGGAIETSGSVPTQGAIQKSGSWWKFWDSETPSDSEFLLSEEINQKIVKSKIHEGVDAAESAVHNEPKTLGSFANAALTAASTKESKIVEEILSITDIAKSKSINAAEKSSKAEAKAMSVTKDKASKSAEKLSMLQEKTKSESSKAAEKSSSAEAKARSVAEDKASRLVEKISRAEADESLKVSSMEAERFAQATNEAKLLKSQEVQRIEKAKRALKTKIAGTTSSSVEDDTEVAGGQFTSDGRLTEEFSTSTKQQPKFISKILSAMGPKLKASTVTDQKKTSMRQAAHSMTDKISDRVSKVTKVVSAQVTDYSYPIADGEDSNMKAGDGLSFEGTYVARFVNTLSSIALTSTFGTLSFFSKLIPTTIGRQAAIPFDEYPIKPTPEATGYCTHCPQTVGAYLAVLGCCVFAAPYVRSLILRTRQKLPGPVAAFIVVLLWIPFTMTIVTGLTYHNHSELESILRAFRGNLYLLAFTLLASAKICRTLVNSISYNFLPNSVPTTNNHIPHEEVTVILPYTYRTNEPGKVFERCIESILVNNVYNVCLLVQDVETRYAAEQFAMRYSSHFTLTIFMSVSRDRRTRFIECCRRARSPITVFVEKGTVAWSSTFLRTALAPFEDLQTALVAPAFHAYNLPADDQERIPIEQEELPTPPSSPDHITHTPIIPQQVYAPDPPQTHTLKQKFLLHLAKLHISNYNFSNLATHNIDGFTTPLSHQTILIRTSILHTSSFQQFYFNHHDPATSITSWVQRAGLRTVFLSSARPLVHLCIPTTPASKSLYSYIHTTLLKQKRNKIRYALDSLFSSNSGGVTTYKRYPWSTFASHMFNLIDIPLVYDTLLFYTLIYGMDAGKGRVCQLLVTLLVLRVLERPGMVWKGSRWLAFNGEFWAWFLLVLGWEYVVESVVGVGALLSFWV